MTERTLAIDISHWWRVNWDEIPAEVQVVLIKATEGNYYIDPQMQAHVEGALAAGKQVGLYHFYRTKIGGRVIPPQEQAEYFLHHTQPYWGAVHLRANDFERSHWVKESGQYYNPTVGTASQDLETFHRTLHQSDWEAFDLLYTNLDTWTEMGLHSAERWRGPQWICQQPYIDGLWLAWWPYARPTNTETLSAFNEHSWQPTLPRPFSEYWAWQVAADYRMPGLYTADGSKPKPADLSIIPHPPEEVATMLGAYPPPGNSETPTPDEPNAFQTGWQQRTDKIMAYLMETRQGEGR